MIDHKLFGKGMWIWKAPVCENGDPAAIVSASQAAGFSHIVIKIHDGIYTYNAPTYYNTLFELVEALQAAGILVFGWGYVYGANPIGEADRAIQRVQSLGLDGYVIDGEGELKGNMAGAATFMDRLRKGLPDWPIGLSSYRFPSYHPTFPWDAFLGEVDFVMPQVYWAGAHNAGEQLVRSLTEYAALAPGMPFIPTGSAYKNAIWSATPADVFEFLAQADRTLKLPAANFWEWGNTRAMPELWSVIAGYTWREPDLPPPPPPPSDLTRVLERLMDIQADQGLIKISLASLGAGQAAIAQDVEEILAKVTDVTPPPPPPPEPDGTVLYQVHWPDKIHAFQEDGVNGSGFPIMVSYPKGAPAAQRIFFDPDRVVHVYPEVIRADSGSRWHRLSPSEYPSTVTVDKLYLEKRQLVKVES